jgi:hypothetical protein
VTSSRTNRERLRLDRIRDPQEQERDLRQFLADHRLNCVPPRPGAPVPLPCPRGASIGWVSMTATTVSWARGALWTSPTTSSVGRRPRVSRSSCPGGCSCGAREIAYAGDQVVTVPPLPELSRQVRGRSARAGAVGANALSVRGEANTPAPRRTLGLTTCRRPLPARSSPT